MPHKKVLDDICNDYCAGEYCILKEVLLKQDISDRTLIQLKCIEKYKYEISNYQKRDIGWEETFQRWVEDGHAEKFAEVYQDSLTFLEIWEKIFGG